MRLDNISWLRDHVINSMIIYPMAGYISMAVEATDQYSSWHNMQVVYLTLREISVENALVLLEESEVEMCLSWRPFSQGTRHNSTVRKEFVISSWTSGEGWKDHCRGLISNAKPFLFPATGWSDYQQEALKSFTASTTVPPEFAIKIDQEDLHSMFERIGICYGPTFRGLDNAHV